MVYFDTMQKGINKGMCFIIIAFLIITHARVFGQIQEPIPRPPIQYGSWEKTYGSGAYNDDCGYSVQTVNGGYIITGFTQNRAFVWLIKTDVNGDTIWTQTYAKKEFNCGYDVEQTTEGGYVIAGYTCNVDEPWYGDHVAYHIKTNIHADTIWTKTFIEDDSDMEKAFSVKQTSDGGYIITGHAWNNYTNSGSSLTQTNTVHATSYVFLLKTDAGGNLSWMRKYMDELPGNYGYSVLQTADGGFIITGGIQGYEPESGPPTGRAFLMNVDANGRQLWIKFFEEYTCGFSIDRTTDGGYIIAGSYSEDGFVTEDVWLLKTDVSGNALWSNTFGVDDRWENGYAVKQDIDGGYVIAGYTNIYDTRGSEVWLIKTDSSGNRIWDEKFGGIYDDIGYSLDLAHNGGYIIAGCKGSDFDEGDVYLIKYSPQPQIEPNTEGMDGGYIHTAILKVSPNPFHSVVYIDVPDKDVEIEHIKVYDRSGRLLGRHPVHNNKIIFDEELRAGVYFIKAEGCKPAKAVKLNQ